ncbi:MAG: class I SAM-dependent methyltransferase [Candidatus Accumulibacter sp.]|jgi:SAM-dependent methyltransferase|uniref:Class I SAM-dependent methyltransferase n=1 Tax=Candidatus Accumulibacter affinis TaxID=2954384 RepID=A0A935W244_9PROT|nr:class I SAM-dependent methyltransferase [Candidatus Accumulibacter affinis]
MSMIDLINGDSYPRLDPIACPLCGRVNSPRPIPARFDMQTSVAECVACRLAYQTPRPSEEASRAYMNWRWSSGDRYVTDSESKRRAAREKLRQVEAVRSAPGRLLDFGAGSGAFVRASLDGGWDTVGVEQSAAAIARAREYYSVDLQSTLPDDRFDVITMWDVVEHLRDPIAVLRLLHERLAVGGRLFLETGNYENWRRVLEGDRWGLYLLDHHFYFTPYSLEIATSRAGFSTFNVLDVDHSAPSLRRLLTRPRWGMRAWRAYRGALKAWPEHGDINVMVAVTTA